VSAFFDSNFAKAYGVYGQLWQSSSRRIKLCQSLRSLSSALAKFPRRIKLCQSLRSLWSALAKFPRRIKLCQSLGSL